MNGGYFLLDAGAVFGEVTSDVEELAGDDVADSAEDREGEDAGDGDCDDAWDASDFEAADGGGEQKGECEGEGERDDEFAREVEDENGDREHQERCHPRKLGGSSTGHTTSRRLTMKCLVWESIHHGYRRWRQTADGRLAHLLELNPAFP